MPAIKIKIKNEGGETRIYLDGVHVGKVYTWCPPGAEMNKGAKRIATVTLVDGRVFNFPGFYRNDVLTWVRTGEWIGMEGDK